MKTGRPTSYKPEYCSQVVDMGKEGKSIAQWCAHFDIARSTIDRWAEENPEFSEAFTRAKVQMQAKLEQMGFEGLTNGNLNPNIWKTTMQARFREDYTERKQIAGDPDAPLTVEYKTVYETTD